MSIGRKVRKAWFLWRIKHPNKRRRELRRRAALLAYARGWIEERPA